MIYSCTFQYAIYVQPINIPYGNNMVLKVHKLIFVCRFSAVYNSNTIYIFNWNCDMASDTE